MISTLLVFILSIASSFGIVPSNDDLAARESAMKLPTQRIAFLKSFSLETFSGATGLRPHLPFNEDSRVFPQSGGDLPVLEVLTAKDLLSPLDLNVSSALAVDTGTKALLYQMNGDEPRVLASLTKLMTVLIVIDQNPDWDSFVEILSSDVVGGESVKFSIGDRVKMRDLLYATLVGSANNAAVALVRGSGLTQERAVELMNERSDSFGLEHTAFVDVTGLRPGNVSTAREFAIVVSNAFSDQRIFEAVSAKRYEIETASGARRAVLTTNWLLRDDKVVAGKTGYIDESGYNLSALWRSGNRSVLTLVFGAPSQEARFSETEKLTQWLRENYVGWE